MTRLHARRGAKLLGLLTLLGLMTGCWGIWWSDDNGPSNEKKRVDFELIPNSVLAKDDTSPEWQLGRYGFKAGANELLVMTRITSWAPHDEDGKETGPRADHQFERAWITIPFGTQVGQLLRAEELEPQFLVGYDASETGTKFYIQPSRIMGTVKIVEENPASVVIAINLIIHPADSHSEWQVNRTVTVPVTAHGVHAMPASPLAVISHRTVTTTTAPATEPASQPTSQPSTQPAAK